MCGWQETGLHSDSKFQKQSQISLTEQSLNKATEHSNITFTTFRYLHNRLPQQFPS